MDKKRRREGIVESFTEQDDVSYSFEIEDEQKTNSEEESKDEQ